MSVTTGKYLGANPGAFYATPAWAVRRIVAKLFTTTQQADRDFTWLDPCAGRGAIVQACTQMGVRGRWTACELEADYAPSLWAQVPAGNHPNPVERVRMGDFFDLKLEQRFDVVILNPPFPLAERFVRACLPIASHVICLQRLNWVAGRKALFDQFPPDMWVLPDRPAFGLNKHGKVGTDAAEYAWYHWRRSPDQGGEFRILDKTSKVERQAHGDLIRQAVKAGAST